MPGISCGWCVRHIKTALEAGTAVKTVDVNLAPGEVTVLYNSQATEPAAIAAAIRKSGDPPRIARAE